MTELRKNMVWAVIFFSLIIVCAALAYIYSALSAPINEAQIFSDGSLVKTVDLKNVSEPYEFEVISADGGHNTVHIERGKIGVSDADCPDRLCQKRGLVSDGSLPIVCLPNRLSIVITGKSGVDAVTGGGF